MIKSFEQGDTEMGTKITNRTGQTRDTTTISAKLVPIMQLNKRHLKPRRQIFYR
jgi:hypothetical protein